MFSSFITSQHFVLIAAPGSGKGTFSQYMIQKHGYVQICPGDIFRQEILQQTELGKSIESIVAAGDYVDENIVCNLMKKHLEEAINKNKQFILDGFPRSENCLAFLKDFLKNKNLLNTVCFLQLQASDELCKERMLGRYICNNCGRVDNAKMMKHEISAKCATCNTELTFRPGDKESVIDKRLVHFHNVIEPLLKQLEADNQMVKKINTMQNLSLLHKAYDEIIS